MEPTVDTDHHTVAKDSQEVRIKPASSEEVEAFVLQNKRWLADDAEKVFRGMSAEDQRRVISAGTMSSVQNPLAVIQARVRKAKDLEAAAVRSGGTIPAVLLGLESKLTKPATPEELEAFLKSNDRWLVGEAVSILRAMSPVDQRRVITAGTMSGCRDSVAVIQTRVKKAREMEMELENLAAGKKPQNDEKPGPATPSFCEEAAAAHLYAPPEEVSITESRFASSADSADGASGQLLMGDVPGVGGVVEMLKAKYGCLKGQRVKVIGETQSLLQFEGGKTAPKSHENSGWKWVIREEEESKQSAAEAQLAALQEAAALQAAQVAAQKAAELARAQAEAKAYAAAQAAIQAKARDARSEAQSGGSSSSSSADALQRKNKKKKENARKDEEQSSHRERKTKKQTKRKEVGKPSLPQSEKDKKGKQKSKTKRKDEGHRSKEKKKKPKKESSSSETCILPKKSKS